MQLGSDVAMVVGFPGHDHCVVVTCVKAFF